MSNKITFKEWLTNFFRGIWQALCWVGRAFSPKNKTPFWRVVWSVITVCVVTLTGILIYTWYFYHNRDLERYGETTRISYSYKYFHPYGKNGYIQNIRTGEKTVKGIEWIAMCEESDSLFVFSRNDKRGYINRHTGEIAIPDKYQKAWNFSSGIASVVENDSLYFIDAKGNLAHNKKFLHKKTVHAPMYRGDYCIMTGNNGKMGLIDRNGDWKVDAIYDWISPEVNNYWLMTGDDNLTYVFNNNAEQLLPEGYTQVEVNKDLGIAVTLSNHLIDVYGFDGVKSEDLHLCQIEKMYYDKDEWYEDGSRKSGETTLMRYRMPDGYEGLCKVSGELVTEPLYWEVLPVTKDTYICKYNDSGVAVIINSKGEIIKQTEL